MRAWPLLVCVALTGCPTRKHEVVEHPVVAAEDPGRETSFVTSSVVVGECPDEKKVDPKKARKEIDELVGSCTAIPGGAAHFSATLLPGGRIELGSPSGDPTEGVVPTCVVQTAKQLKHRLKLKKPCRFDVELEQRSS
jgi:hypothetical protein